MNPLAWRPLAGGLAFGVAVMWGGALRRALAARKQSFRNSEPATWPAVSVIVPAWCEAGTLETCLEHVSGIDYPSWDVTVVAAGDDGTFDVARREQQRDPRIAVLRQRPGGKNRALNDGVRVTRGQVLVFLDADSVVGPNYLRALLHPLQGHIVATTGSYSPLCPTLVARVGEMYKIAENQVRGRVTLNGSGGIAIRRDILAELGGFPEGPIADDWDLTQRLRSRGYDIAFAAGAVVYTQSPASLREWWANEVRWRRIHLRSLFRLRTLLMRGPVDAMTHLYPYLTAWGFLLLGASLLGLRAFPPQEPNAQEAPARASARSRPALARNAETGIRRFRRGFSVLWLVAGAHSVARELAVAVEAVAYTGKPEWLPAAPLIPVLTVIGHFAAIVATLTARHAPVQHKGPRRRLCTVSGRSRITRRFRSIEDGGTSAREAPWPRITVNGN